MTALRAAWERLPAPVRRPAGLVLATALLLLGTQVVLPGPVGVPGRGTPVGILYQGLTLGLLTALSTVAIILVYRTQRIINFAQVALGIAGSSFFFGLVQFTSVPFPIAFLLALVVGGICGAGVGAILLRFATASRLVLTVVTIIGSGFLVNASYNVYRLPIFPAYSDLTTDQQVGNVKLDEFLPFAGWNYQVGGYPVPFGFAQAFAVEASIVVLLLVGAFFLWSRYGLALRAMAENPQRASLLGIGVGGLSMVVWALAGVLSAASGALQGMVTTPAQAGGFTPVLLIVAIVAAVIARMEDLVVGVAASVFITVASSAFTLSFPGDAALVNVGLLVVLVATLLLRGGGRSRADAGQAVSWTAVQEQRPVPRELARLAPVRAVRYSLIGAGLLFLVAVPFVFSPRFIDQASVFCLAAIVTLSVVVLTGWGGQVSLGQWGFAAVGAVLGGALTATAGVPFWFAVPLAAAFTGAFAALVGLPALRIPGLFLLPVTLVFASVAAGVLFEERYFGWLLPERGGLARPTLFFLDFGDNRSMYFLCVACLVLSIVVVTNLRRSRTGRVLIALRENDANVQAFGVDVVRTKLLAFAISGALSGFAGAVFAHQQLGLNPQSFSGQRSVQAFIEAVFGGLGSITGALLGAAFFIVTQYLTLSAVLGLFVQNGGPLFLIAAAPGGLVSIVNGVRDSVLRVVAQRRQIIVPTLFADTDPDALRDRLIPLAEPEAAAGLAALPPDRRFVLPSVLYRRRARAGASS